MQTPSHLSRLRSSWWYVARLIAFRPWLYVFSTVSIIASYLWPLATGIVVRQIFDQLTNRALLTSDARSTIWALAGVLFGVAFAQTLTAFGYPFGEKALMLITDALMRQNLLRSILRRPGANALPSESSPGEAISRLRDDMAHISIFMTWTADPIGQILAFGIAFVTLARIDLRVTLFGFLPLLVILTVVNLLTKRIRHYRKETQEAIGQVTGLLGELFGAVQAVKVAGAERHVVAHLQRVNEVRRATALRDQFLTNLVNAFSFGATNIATGVLLILAAQSLQSGRLSVGDFALFASYLSWMAFVMGMVGGYVAKYQQVGVSLQRAVDLLQDEPSTLLTRHDPDVRMRGTLPALSTAEAPDRQSLRTLSVTGLTYRYPGSNHGVEAVDLRIKRGQIVVITGRIGSGKSTLLRALLGLLPPQSGEVNWNDQRVDDLAAFMVPPQVAYTPQTPRLFSESLRDNLLMGLYEEPTTGDDRLQSALHQSVLERDVLTLDHGLDTMVGPRGVRLSGGQLQRAAAARMFVRRPELLVFDDLSSALDVETEQVLWERLARRSDQTTVIAVSHRRVAFQRADWIIVLADGRIAAEGRLEDLITSSVEMRDLWFTEKQHQAAVAP